ncbi:B-cell receptor CD22-like isoform X1 [Trematomus bernacchii]|uniref:B-cell receptor CD22-like isoform X1 n=1 Tax=Trematomus bernacchii TaxID=40690 RepID=UPI00146AD1B1|nr:B-cell receptor CD22-like isoform X1 [Trematomus bernacchii]
MLTAALCGTPPSHVQAMQFIPSPAATDTQVQTSVLVGACSHQHAPSPQPGCKPFSARPASPDSARTPGPPPSSLVIGDSIVRNIRSKTAATYCFPGGRVLDLVEKIPCLLMKHPHARNVIIHVGTNDTACQQSERRGIFQHMVPPSLLTEMRGAAMSLTAAASGLVVFLLSVSVVQGQDGWGVTYSPTEICAVKGSTVEIRCSYTFPSPWRGSVNTVEKTFWFTKWRDGEPVDLTTDSEYAGRVEDLGEKNICTLRIRNLTESDSAEYKFRFETNQAGGKYGGSTGVTLSVSNLQVTSDTNWLFCQSSYPQSSNPSYIWYKNGQIIQGETSRYTSNPNNADSYSCALKGYEDFPSPAVYGPKLPSVSVSPSAEIEEGSSVTLTCSTDANPAANYIWYKKNGNQKLPPLTKEPKLFFSSIQSSDSGQYFCAAENELGKRTSEMISVDVKFAPKLPSVSVSPSAEIEEGSSVTLTCSSDANPAANYTWYKKNQNAHLSSVNEAPFVVLSSIQSSDSGQYYCTAENKLGSRRSESIFIDVTYAPKLPSVSVSPSAEIEEGSSVTLTCSSDANPAANYTWYKEDEDSPKASGQIFTITDFRAEHSGSYSCGAQNKLGRSNSNLHLSVGTGSSTMIVNIIRTTLGVLILILVFLLSLWMRKKKALRSTTEAPEPEEIELDSDPEYENDSDTAAQTEDTEEQEDLV